MLGSFGPSQLIILLFIVLIIFGAGKLPEVGRSFGGAIKEFKNSVRENDDRKDNDKGGKSGE